MQINDLAKKPGGANGGGEKVWVAITFEKKWGGEKGVGDNIFNFFGVAKKKLAYKKNIAHSTPPRICFAKNMLFVKS